MLKIAIASVAMFVGLGGASSIVVGIKRPPIEPEQVQVYMDEPANYEKVAIIEASSAGSFALTDQQKTNKAIERLKKEAAKLGANGVLLTSVGPKSGGFVNTGSANYGNGYAYGTGVAIPVEHRAGSGIAIYVPPAPSIAPTSTEVPATEPTAEAQPATGEMKWKIKRP